MGNRRLLVWGTTAAIVAAGVVVTSPPARHVVRHMIAQHRHVPFGRTVATPVVPIAQALPTAPSDRLDLRFSPRPIAEETAVILRAPLVDAGALAPPTVVTAARTVAAASAATPLDRTTEDGPSTPAAEPDFTADLAGARQALRHYHEGDLASGDDFARMTGGALRTALDWAAVKLQPREAGAARLQAFSVAHPAWPLKPWIDRRIEEAVAATRDLGAIRAMFANRAPQTLAGTLALARARLASGETTPAANLVQTLWRNEDLTAPEEASVLKEFGTLLRKEDHKARADRLLYKETVPAALRAAALAGPDVTILARARAAVIAGSPSDAAIAAVPKPLQADPGLLYSRIQKARRAGRIEEAAGLIQAAPQDAAALVDGDAWWIERRLVARKLLDAGNAKLAYAVAAGEAASTNAMKIEGEFHAGWIALQFLQNPALAAPHFAAVSQLGETPISNARGAYWQGRAAEAAGNTDDAARYYGEAAALTTTFYGQLAAAKLGRPPLTLRPAVMAATGAARAESVRAVGMLFALGERDIAVSLAVATAKTEPDPAQVAALAAVVEATGDARATLVVGKAGSQRGMPIEEAAFPTFGIPGYQPIQNSADRATVLAIARQESEFDPRSVSAAGAMGLMQLIGSTARKTAQDAGIGFDETRLLTDAAFNARIGAAHLGKLLSDLDGSYILTFAAYNAGAGRVRDWIAAYGDPRKPGVDPIDWIERIPFTETRNYVQRVFENMQIYRAQFGMPRAVLTASQPLVAGKGT